VLSHLSLAAVAAGKEGSYWLLVETKERRSYYPSIRAIMLVPGLTNIIFPFFLLSCFVVNT
jgi:hypothetical protein